jgi:hypothetical protein
VSTRSLFRLIVVLAAVAVTSCGGGGARRAAPAKGAGSVRADSLAPVLSACETGGGSSLLPDTGGRDTSPVPDDTRVVCGCWVTWMGKHLGPGDRAAAVTDVVLSASVMAVTDTAVLDRLAAALRSCEPSPAPGTDPIASRPAPMSSPGP